MSNSQVSDRLSLFLLAFWSVILSGIAGLVNLRLPSVKKKAESEFDFTFDFDDYEPRI